MAYAKYGDGDGVDVYDSFICTVLGSLYPKNVQYVVVDIQMRKE